MTLTVSYGSSLAGHVCDNGTVHKWHVETVEEAQAILDKLGGAPFGRLRPWGSEFRSECRNLNGTDTGEAVLTAAPKHKT